MFKFTSKTIAGLWRDLKKMNVEDMNNSNKWQCTCGCSNTGKFCSDCGAQKPADNN